MSMDINVELIVGFILTCTCIYMYYLREEKLLRSVSSEYYNELGSIPLRYKCNLLIFIEFWDWPALWKYNEIDKSILVKFSNNTFKYIEYSYQNSLT